MCHHPSGIAPFPLTNYKETARWAKMIREVVTDRRMPPWDADPRHGRFKNERRMTDEEIQTIVAWVGNGAPRGDGQARISPPRTGGWRIGKPDVVFRMPQTATVPASGVMPYQYYWTPTNFSEDKWVRAVEAKPGNERVVHHILVYVRSNRANNAEQRLLGLGSGLLDGYAPGDEPLKLDPNVGLQIPAGSWLLWQLHYTPTGKVEKDQSQLAMVFADTPPRYVHKTATALNRNFVIPAGASNYRVQSQFTFPGNAWLTSLTPHMHLRGKSFTYEALYPNGKKEVLLHVPHYDFNWQTTYELQDAKPIPRGTRIICTAHFDNSSRNPYNPNPRAAVGWGDQTWDEMMIGWFNFVWEPRR